MTCHPETQIVSKPVRILAFLVGAILAGTVGGLVAGGVAGIISGLSGDILAMPVIAQVFFILGWIMGELLRKL